MFRKGQGVRIWVALGAIVVIGILVYYILKRFNPSTTTSGNTEPNTTTPEPEWYGHLHYLVEFYKDLVDAGIITR